MACFVLSTENSLEVAPGILDSVAVLFRVCRFPLTSTWGGLTRFVPLKARSKLPQIYSNLCEQSRVSMCVPDVKKDDIFHVVPPKIHSNWAQMYSKLCRHIVLGSPFLRGHCQGAVWHVL